MKRCLLGLPVDARPVVRSQVQTLVACAGWALRMPEPEALGYFRQPADRDALHQWLLEQAEQADGFVISLDMAVYGGLVPSRFIDDPLPELLDRLAQLSALKTAFAHKPLYAFAATMRISNNNFADEEKTYWAQHGPALWRWSFHSDHAQHGGGPEAAAAAAQAQAEIPAAIRADYLATRQRNFSVTLAALQAVRDRHIDRLVLPQDDTAMWGFNIAERRLLQAKVLDWDLADRVLIYPGADEVMHTLSAHLVQRLTRSRPLRVALAPSDPQGIPTLSALYEDRPLLQSVQHQLLAVGAEVLAPEEDDIAAADVLLALHTQGSAQGDWAMQRPLPQRPGVDPDWFQRLRQAQQAGVAVVLVDLAFANGGDPWLLARLQDHSLPMPFTYAGWNTASNSLGGALAHAALAHVSGGEWFSAANRQVCALRLLEDGLYQGLLRQALRGCVNESEIDTEIDIAALESTARQLVLPWCNTWAAGMRLGWRVRGLRLPWGRSFEIDLDLEPSP